MLKNPRAADLPTANYLRQQLDDLAQQYDRKPSTSVLPGLGHLHAEITFLRSHALGNGIRNAFGMLEAESATLMGQLVWDASQRRDCRTAVTYYEQAIDADDAEIRPPRRMPGCVRAPSRSTATATRAPAWHTRATRRISLVVAEPAPCPAWPCCMSLRPTP